jgi:hypothetical protein
MTFSWSTVWCNDPTGGKTLEAVVDDALTALRPANFDLLPRKEQQAIELCIGQRILENQGAKNFLNNTCPNPVNDNPFAVWSKVVQHLTNKKKKAKKEAAEKEKAEEAEKAAESLGSSSTSIEIDLTGDEEEEQHPIDLTGDEEEESNPMERTTSKRSREPHAQVFTTDQGLLIAMAHVRMMNNILEDPEAEEFKGVPALAKEVRRLVDAEKPGALTYSVSNELITDEQIWCVTLAKLVYVMLSPTSS